MGLQDVGFKAWGRGTIGFFQRDPCVLLVQYTTTDKGTGWILVLFIPTSVIGWVPHIWHYYRAFNTKVPIWCLLRSSSF